MTLLWHAAAPLVLASKSSARQALLLAAGIPFDAFPASIDEREVEGPLVRSGAGAAEIALHLASAKARFIAVQYPDRLILGADQTLSLKGSIFSKPNDLKAAAAQLSAMSGQTHELHSALCLVKGSKILFSAVPSARLTCRAFSSDFIDRYLETAGEKALSSVGAYQVEGLGIHLFDQIEGDHSTILGLPLIPLLRFLREEGSLAA
jgi:septum formation protein